MDFLNDISIGRLLLITSPLLILQATLAIAAAVSIARKELPWSEKWLWLVIALFVNIIGPIVYFAVGANMLEEKVAAHQDAEESDQWTTQ